MKNYVAPKLNVIAFTLCDVITASVSEDPAKDDLVWSDD